MLVVWAPLNVPDSVRVVWPTAVNGPTAGFTIVPLDV